MRILFNGEARDVAAPTLQGVLSELGFDDKVIATALNGEFIASTVRADKALTEGDRIEVLAPMQGG